MIILKLYLFIVIRPISYEEVCLNYGCHLEFLHSRHVINTGESFRKCLVICIYTNVQARVIQPVASYAAVHLARLDGMVSECL